MFDSEYREISDEVIAGVVAADGFGLPTGLGEMEPGPLLAAVLSQTDVALLSGYDRVVVLRAQQRMASHYNAGVYRSMAAVTEHIRQEEDDDYQMAAEAAEAEIRVALRLTRRATRIELSFALELHERLPQVAAALEAGAIDVRRAKTIAYHTVHLTTATARTVVDQIIDQAPHLTTGQLGAQLTRLCIEADPQEAHDRYHHANTDRRIVAEPTIEGTTNLHGFDLAPDQVAKAMRRINHLAQSLRRTGESRTIDQLRADVYLDLLNGTRHHSTKDSRGVVDIRVDLATLTRLSEHPGELAGYGPVIADIARRVADNSTDAEWRYTVTDSTSGHITHTGTTQRRHTAKQRRHIEVRDQTCIFPGCRIPATACDIDHTTAHSEGGPTTVVNGGPLCRHDHGTKHKHRCTYLRLPTGDYQWTSRLGHTYTTSGQPP